MQNPNVENPTQLHMSAAKRVLRNMERNADEMVMMHSSRDGQSNRLIDASWVANIKKK